MLMPAAVLIVLLLGAIAVDSAIVYLGQRKAYNVAAAAANDAVGAGFDRDVLRTSGDIVYDPDRLRDIAHEAVSASGIDGLVLVAVEFDGDGAVAVTVQTTIHHLFVQAFGDASRDTITVTASATGELRDP